MTQDQGSLLWMIHLYIELWTSIEKQAATGEGQGCSLFESCVLEDESQISTNFMTNVDLLNQVEVGSIHSASDVTTGRS